MLFPVFKAIIGHYRRRPFQILLIWIGLTLGTALLVGVMAVNHHAQVSYAQGEKIFSNPLPYRIRARVSDQSVPSGLYLQLRQAGFNQCIPIDSQEVRTKSGLDLKLVGFDPISMLSYQPQANINDTSSLALMKPPYPVKISPDLMKRYDLQSGQYFELEDGRKVGPIQIDRENLAHGNQVFMDIAEFRAFTAQKQLSLIACGVMPAAKAEQLRQLLPSDLFLSRYTAMELTSLTNAFHLNLTALGMLAFMVGMFIFYQAMARSFAQRQHLVGSLRLLGVRRLKIAMCLGVELILWVIVSWLSGNVIGLMLANYLIPEVAETLNQLYDIKINLIVNWQWGWSLQSLGMVFVACIIASLWPFLRLMNTLPVRLSTYLSLSRFSGNQFGWEALFGCACIVAAVALYLRPPSQEIGFLLIGAIMLSVGLIVPFLLWRLFVETAKHCKTLNMRWFFSDCASSM
ncbi:MAG: ABC transporter permease, partial [Vibrio sp.]